MQSQELSPSEIAEINTKLDEILKEHRGHSVYTVVCRMCIYNASYQVQKPSTAEAEARAFLSEINLVTINTAIQDVSKALGDFDMVTQFRSGVEPIG